MFLSNKKWFLLFKIVIAISVMYLIVQRIQIRMILETIQNPEQPVYIVIAIVLLFPNLFFLWYRWHYLLKLIQPEVTLRESVQSVFGGMVVGFLTPGRIGEFGRSLFLEHIDRLQAFGLVFLDKFYALVTLVVGGIIGFILIFAFAFNWTIYILMPMILIGISISGILIWLAIRPDILRGFLYHLAVMLPVREKLQHVIGCMDQLNRQKASTYLWISAAFYMTYIAQFCLLANAFEFVAPVRAFAASTSTMFAKTFLPISFGDLGIREGASVFFFMKMNAQKVTAFNSAFLLFVINVLSPTLIGLFFLPKLTLSMKTEKPS